jgi:uncharacterized YccA/Bax inhibitor family protein
MPLNNDSPLTRTARTGNPGLNSRTFLDLPHPAAADERMTVGGTVNKAFLLLVVLMGCALWPWSQYLSSGNAAAVGAPLLIGTLGGLILAVIISFKATMAPYLSLPYAACEGLAIGAISAVLERKYPGIAIQAVALTFGVLAAMLLAYKTGLIRATQRLRAIVVSATGAIMLLYLVSMLLRLFHVGTPFLYSSSPLSLGLSLVIIAVAALNLVLDFDMIETGAAQGVPRYMEWYGAFGLLVTLVWLYLEILRFLGNARQR